MQNKMMVQTDIKQKLKQLNKKIQQSEEEFQAKQEEVAYNKAADRES